MRGDVWEDDAALRATMAGAALGPPEPVLWLRREDGWRAQRGPES